MSEEQYVTSVKNVHVEDDDVVVRRIHKKHHIKENGKVKFQAFMLRANAHGGPEREVSVYVEKVAPAPKLSDEKRYAYCQLIAGEIRSTGTGVWHSPSTNTRNHGSLCGCFDQNRAQAISRCADVI